MHTIFLEGGLGNQLFMTFTVLGHAMKHKTPFFFEDRAITTGTRTKTYWDTFLKTLSIFRQKLEAKYAYREPGHHYNEIPSFPDNAVIRLHGYFQSYKYFHEYRDSIFKSIELERQKDRLVLKLSERDWDNTISMHFRIGDYKNLPQYHPIQPIEYYTKALANFEDDSKWTVLYFCEEQDVDEVNMKINILREQYPKLTFERMKEKLEDWEEMLAMSLCRHHIIANSSFSYFGAYFNTREEVQVYYPSLWLGPALSHKRIDDMCPPNWTQIRV
jgi:hypothetical protein